MYAIKVQSTQPTRPQARGLMQHFQGRLDCTDPDNWAQLGYGAELKEYQRCRELMDELADGDSPMTNEQLVK
jgi:hypothetical protein